MIGMFKFHAFYAILCTEKILYTLMFGIFKFHAVPSCIRNKYFIYLYNKDLQLSALPNIFKNQNLVVTCTRRRVCKCIALYEIFRTRMSKTLVSSIYLRLDIGLISYLVIL
jgi:hypothetical protein